MTNNLTVQLKMSKDLCSKVSASFEDLLEAEAPSISTRT